MALWRCIIGHRDKLNQQWNKYMDEYLHPHKWVACNYPSFLNITGGLVKPSLRLRHGWIIISSMELWFINICPCLNHRHILLEKHDDVIKWKHFRVTGPLWNSSVTGEFAAQRPVTRSFDVFFDLRLNKRLSKQPWGWWFETPSRPLCRHWNGKGSLRGYLFSFPPTVSGMRLSTADAK